MENNYVWVVQYIDWDAYTIYGIYTTRELAEQRLQSLLARGVSYQERDKYSISMVELDKDETSSDWKD